MGDNPNSLDPRFFQFTFLHALCPRVEWDDVPSDTRIEHHVRKRLWYQIFKNKDIIEDRKVLDFAASWGYFSYAMALAGAQHVLATDARQSNVDAMRLGFQHCSLEQSVDVMLHDINDHDSFANLFNDVQTIHLSGIIYHVNNHFALLKKLSDLKADAIIVDTVVPHRRVYFDDTSTITWYTEDQCDQLAGIDSNFDRTNYAGYPNKAWLYDVLKLLGWNIRSHDLISMLHPEDKLHFRSVVTATR